MSRLKKVEKYAIQWLSSQGYEIVEIVNELNIAETTVKNCLEKYKQTNTENNIKTSSSTVGGAQNRNLMITQTFGKKNIKSDGFFFREPLEAIKLLKYRTELKLL